MSDALRLADALEACSLQLGEPEQAQAASELRRLHDLVEEDSIVLRRQRDEIAQLGQALARAIERNNELEAELAEQARVNGMGGEREARLMAENEALKTVMVAAAEEISEHWDAHCDSEGYGPVNLMRRLEEGIPSQYGYTAGAFERLRALNAELVEALKTALHAFAEIHHAYMRPNWFTGGERSAAQHLLMHQQRGSDAARAALAKVEASK